MKENKIAIILVGGKGSRLWPISRENHPKQFVEFKEGLSLFQLTLGRTLKFFKDQNIYILSGENYKFTIYNQIDAIPELSANEKQVLKNNLIFEPCARNTAPAVMLGLKYLETFKKCDESTIFYALPSDQIIEPDKGFGKFLDKAASIAESDKIVLFGVSLKVPKQDFGYITKGSKISNGFLVEKFVEKPSLATAKALIKKGALGNAGIFCFKKDVFIKELKCFKPQIGNFYDLPFMEMVSGFNKIPSDSIDYAVIQKSKNSAVIDFDLKWDDLGNWDSFLEYHHDGRHNFSIGKSEFMECKSCFTYSNSKDRVVSLIGVEDTIVVDSPDALLIVKKGFSDKVKNLTDTLNDKGEPVIKDSTTVYRPWGYYTILKEEPGFKVKKIGVYPGKSLSLQKHKHRSEHWNVVEGRGIITIGNKQFPLKRNESIYVPKGEKHKLHNPTKKNLAIIEVQIGNYLGEDDIIRFDKY